MGTHVTRVIPSGKVEQVEGKVGRSLHDGLFLVQAEPTHTLSEVGGHVCTRQGAERAVASGEQGHCVGGAASGVEDVVPATSASARSFDVVRDHAMERGANAGHLGLKRDLEHYVVRELR